ncbi:hypothetical protein P1X15_10045 [Runella sp. MFBS21]|uniref:hypothetical protein n=1 Tax=Runella sp. MFBS21 TaxID=3034018 RepID=UPI0023F89AB5|nr:hypothetical protein [Runella sp. MFBS21]MDF7817939.1 hypothetical protein [Runella sp. MFBS21]
MSPTKSSGTIPLNPWQVKFLQAPQRIKAAVCGRGSAKTNTLNHVIGLSARQLPRAKASLNCTHFGQALEIILEQSEDIWKQYGWHLYEPKTGRGNYTLFRRPPDDWPRPLFAPKKWENVISFKSGYCLQLRSYDRPNTNRGGNDSQNFIDEAAWFKEDWVNKIILPRNRAPIDISSPLNLAFYFFTSVPTDTTGQWIWKYEELAQTQPDKYYWASATAYDNYALLKKVPDYVQTQYDLLDPITFAIEMMNERIEGTGDGFYPSFKSELHVSYGYSYEFDDELGLWHKEQNDYNPDAAIEVSIDANAAFTSCTVWQEKSGTEHCLNALFVKPNNEKSNLVQRLAFKFNEEYVGHRKKVVYLWGDRNTTSKAAHTVQTQLDVFSETIRDLGWTVISRVNSFNWQGKDKHFFIDEILLEKNPRLPKVRINEKRAKPLIYSVQQAPINDDFSKNKNSERSKIPQELATHLSDTLDYYLCGKYGSRIGRFGASTSVIPTVGWL